MPLDLVPLRSLPMIPHSVSRCHAILSSVRWVWLGAALAVAIALVPGGGRAQGDDGPLGDLKGVFSGTIHWPLHQRDARSYNELIPPVLREEQAGFVLAIEHTAHGAKLHLMFAHESYEAWIAESMRNYSNAAPTETANRCAALGRLREWSRRDPELWMACEPLDTPGASPPC